jgi:hypothetical protein
LLYKFQEENIAVKKQFKSAWYPTDLETVQALFAYSLPLP